MSDQGQTPEVLFRTGWSTKWKCNERSMSLSRSLLQLAEQTNITEAHIEHQQQLTFADGEEDISSLSTSLDYRTITDDGLDISHFFERPIKIEDLEWDDNAGFYRELSIWYSYFSLSTVRQKLRGYSRMACEGLEVDIRINGSPFRYGCILASYRPLFSRIKRIAQTESDSITRYYPVPYCDFSGGHILEDGIYDPGYQASESYNLVGDGNSMASFISRSQRQCVYLDVASSQGGKLVLPFLCPKESIQLDFCSLANGGDFDKYANRSYFMRSLMGLGTLTLESLHVLRNLQAATVNGVTISIYVKPVGVRAWLSSANASLDRQGLSSMFSNLWTPKSKNEAAIASNSESAVLAPLTRGEKPTIKDFARRPAIVTIDPWNTTYVPGYAIAAIPIHPMHRIMSTYSGSRSPSQLRFAMTPAAFVSMNYRLWRGTARITLRAITTQFHKGRLRVTWEPDLVSYAGVGVASSTYVNPTDPVSKSYIWDISTSSEVTFDVGFGSTTDRLNVPPLRSVGCPSTFSTITGSNTGIVTSDLSLDNFRDYINGFLMVHVENKLQAPTDCTVSIVTSISFPDLELFDSISQTTNLDHLADSTSGTAEYPISTTFEDDLYVADYATIPAMSTRPHTSAGLIPQGIGTVPKNLDSTAKIDHTFLSASKVPCVDVMTSESLMDLVTREVLYDVHQFEVPMAQEVGTNAETTNKKLTSMYYPPYLIKGILPVIPSTFGTTSPCPSMQYCRNAEGNDVAYTMTISSSTRSFTPNLARTHFSLLVKECYVGFRSSFKWRFKSIAGNGIKSQYVAAERVNAGPNKVLGTSHTRSGSYPTLQPVSPYATSYFVDTNTLQANPSLLKLANVVVKPLNYNYSTSTMVVDPDAKYDYPLWYTRFGETTTSFSVATLQELRRRMIAGFGSFFTGGAYSRDEVCIHVPHFARTRYLPSSALGWLFPESNQENSAAICLTAVTEAVYSAVTTSNVQNSGAATWHGITSFPSRATMTFMSSVCPGDDFEVTHLLNVPNLYVLTSNVYDTEKNRY